MSIPRHLSLVTQLPEREAALRAIVHVEETVRKVSRFGSQLYPYARAFFRFLCGSSKISGRALNQVRGVYWLKEEKIPLARYEEAIDVLIRSRGRHCYSPLDSSMVNNLFPEQAFNTRERQENRCQREDELYSRQEARRGRELKDKYNNLVGQAEIDLAFHTPETIRTWYARWSHRDIHDYDLQKMLWAWTERCPSLIHLVREYYQSAQEVVLDAHDVATVSTPEERELERWMVPNKITLREVWP